MIEKVFLKLIAVLTVVIVGLLARVIYTLCVPLNLFDAPAVWPVVQHAVSPGDDVISAVKFCKKTELPAEVGRMTLGKDLSGKEYLFIHPTASGSFPSGCFFRYIAVATLPANAPPGKYRVSIALRYQYSVFRVVRHHFVTEEFDVVPKAARGAEGGVLPPHGQN